MIKFLIPEKINLEQLENKYLLKKNITAYKRDKLAYIFNQLIYMPLYNEKYEAEDAYVPLNAEILHKMLGGNYNQLLNFLTNNFILDSNNVYCENQSTGYRINKDYVSASKEYVVTDFTFKRKLKKYYEEHCEKQKKNYGFLINWLDKLEINQELAEFYINEDFQIKTHNPELWSVNKNGKAITPIKQLDASKITIEAFNSKYGLFKTVDKFGYRFHSVLTNMRSTLRSALTYQGQQLMALDIKNSQPYFAIKLFQKEFWSKAIYDKRYRDLILKMLGMLPAKNGKILNKNAEGINKIKSRINNNRIVTIMFTEIDGMLDMTDVQRYINLVKNGGLYENFINEYENVYGTSKSREVVKLDVLKLFFSENRHSNKAKNLFKQIYPTVTMLFEFIKSKNYKILSCLLQRIESDAVIENICRTMREKYPKVPLYTIHDSIATTIDNIDLLEKVMLDYFTTEFVTPPKLKRESWEENNIHKKLNELKTLIPTQVATAA